MVKEKDCYNSDKTKEFLKKYAIKPFNAAFKDQKLVNMLHLMDRFGEIKDPKNGKTRYRINKNGKETSFYRYLSKKVDKIYKKQFTFYEKQFTRNEESIQKKFELETACDLFSDDYDEVISKLSRLICSCIKRKSFEVHENDNDSYNLIITPQYSNIIIACVISKEDKNDDDKKSSYYYVSEISVHGDDRSRTIEFSNPEKLCLELENETIYEEDKREPLLQIDESGVTLVGYKTIERKITVLPIRYKNFDSVHGLSSGTTKVALKAVCCLENIIYNIIKNKVLPLPIPLSKIINDD